MNEALRRARLPLKHGTYLDDCPIGGATVQEAWEGTLEAIRCLLCLGLPINVWKCQFLVRELNLLGMLLAEGHY